jgi:putative redox protein
MVRALWARTETGERLWVSKRPSGAAGGIGARKRDAISATARGIDQAARGGVPMDSELKEVIDETQQVYRADSDKAKIVFKTSSELGGRFRSDVSIRDHSLTIDEPKAIGGTDLGPSPVEVILAALGSCQEITYRAFAAAMGIELDKVSVELEGHIDFRGFFAVDESVRPGFDKIRAVVKLESSAPADKLEKLREVVNSHCPVLDMLTNPVPVTLDLTVNDGN